MIPKRGGASKVKAQGPSTTEVRAVWRVGEPQRAVWRVGEPQRAAKWLLGPQGN